MKKTNVISLYRFVFQRAKSICIKIGTKNVSLSIFLDNPNCAHFSCIYIFIPMKCGILYLTYIQKYIYPHQNKKIKKYLGKSSPKVFSTPHFADLNLVKYLLYI